jgi:hypothetical protein
MSNLDLFPLISPSDIVSITKLTLILKIIYVKPYDNIKDRNRRLYSGIYKYRILAVMKVETEHITSIAASPMDEV